MADAMTPDEMRREANRLRLVADLNGARGWEHNAESCRRGADALDRLADVIEDMEGYYGGENIGEWHVDCDAGEVWRIARGRVVCLRDGRRGERG